MINKTETLSNKQLIQNLVFLTLILILFYYALKFMSASFKGMGADTAQDLLTITSNPFVSLFIGMLATAIIQSSSTTTTVIVGLVASTPLTVAMAVPLIMGANIGTSVTSSILAFGHIGKKKEYMRALASATVHDFFNIMVVVLLFPLEYFFSGLSRLGEFVVGFIGAEGTAAVKEVKVPKQVMFIVDYFGLSVSFSGVLLLLVSFVMLFFSLRYLTKILKVLVIGNVEKNMDKLVFKQPLRALTWGGILTMAVQSSSVTTSLMVPLVAAKKVSLRKAFPFLMGANIGTTITALISAILGGTREGLAIAFVHVLFNVLGVLIFFPFEKIRNIPILMAEKLASWSYRNRLIGIFYVAFTFFILPIMMYLVTK